MEKENGIWPCLARYASEAQLTIRGFDREKVSTYIIWDIVVWSMFKSHSELVEGVLGQNMLERRGRERLARP
jgi:hypothetical protein